ncbi:MAG: hypothetical protein IVW36_02445 [Dehalococcoidia bacterium]|nr:hypothetical protein [Dehalococcoidia bacterium]
MRQFRTNAKIWAIVLGVVATLAMNAELGRRRRQAARLASTATADASSATTGDVVRAGEEPAAPRALHQVRRARGKQAGQPPAAARRRLAPRLVAAAVIAVALVPVTLALRPSTPAVVATLRAEAADTPDGVMLTAYGSGFTPGQQVRLYWQDRQMAATTTTASPSGDVQARMALPGSQVTSMADASGSVDLTASDGTNTATQPVTVAPSSAVLAATSGARVPVNGTPYFLLGANYPWVNYGNDFGSNAWGSMGVSTSNTYAQDFADMKAKGVHIVRWWLFADGRAGINYAADGTPTGVQQKVYDDLNAAIAIARQNNIYLDLVLFDFSLFGNAQNVGGVQVGGRSRLISDPNKRTALVNNVIRPLAQAYGSEPTIASWELMNEPEWILSDLPQPAVNANMQPVTMQQFFSYASAASQMFHLYTRSLVTIGSASLKWNAIYTNSFAAARGLPALNLDYYQTHYYSWMDGWTINDPVLGKTALSPLAQPVSGLNLDRPIVVGEISMDPGQAGPLLDTVLNNGYAGFWGWSYKSNNTGDKLAIDWSTFTPWEQAHASIVRIGAAVGPAPASPTATNTVRPPTATNTATPGAATPTSTRTTIVSAPAATKTATPTSTRTTIASAPTATRTATPTSTRTTIVPAPTATQTATAAPTDTPAEPTLNLLNYGRITMVGVNDDMDAGSINGSLVYVPVDGALRSLAVYVGATRPNAHLRLGLYTNVNNALGTLVAQADPGHALQGWNMQGPTSSPVLEAGSYWIVAQTDSVSTVYRIGDQLPRSLASGFSPQPYGPYPQKETGWAMQSGTSFSMFLTIDASDGTQTVPTSTATFGVPTATATPTRTALPATTTPTATATSRAPTPTTPVSTSTSTPTPRPTAAPTATPTPTLPSGAGDSFDAAVCGAKTQPNGQSVCGQPPRFCDTWVGGFCNDYRSKQTLNTNPQPFPQPGDAASLDCLSSTSAGQTSSLPYYLPTDMTEWEPGEVPGAQIVPSPCGMSFNEHIMTQIEDGQFGMVVMRQQQPFDFAGRTGRIHFDVDLNTLARRYPRLVLSPQLTKTAIDDRSSQPVTNQSLEVWFRNGGIQVVETRNGQLVDQYPSCNGCGEGYLGQANARDSVDIYVSRTRVHIDVNGVTRVDTPVQDAGFDRAYVYFEHVNYNSCKAYATEGYATVAECQAAGNTFHWDNIAFDGPKLPLNSLTPTGYQDVVFNVWSATTCSVKGVPATGPAGDYKWSTWVARLPASTPVSPGDVQCSGGSSFGLYRGTPMGFEIVKQ